MDTIECTGAHGAAAPERNRAPAGPADHRAPTSDFLAGADSGVPLPAAPDARDRTEGAPADGAPVEEMPQPDMDAAPPAAGTAPSLARRRRGPQQPIAETAYLTAQDVRHYRPLMRFFFERHQAQRFFLRVDEAHRHLQETYDAAYTEDQCQADLEQLAAWGNLTRHYERARVRTIEEFLRRQAVYQITPEGALVERFVANLEAEGRRSGSLDPTVLDALLHRMRELDALLAGDNALAALQGLDGAGGGPASGRIPTTTTPGTPEGAGTLAARASGASAAAPAAPSPGAPAVPSGPRAQERISSLWAEVRHHFERVAHDGVGYLGELRGVQAQQILEHSAFHAYKDALVRYLSSYALALADSGPLIARISRGWAEGARGRVLALSVASVASRQPLPDGTYPVLADAEARAVAGIAALARWFHPSGDVQRLMRSTNDAIELVTRQAARLAELRWGTRSRRHELEELAILFGHCAALPQAERVASVAFAASLPRHWRRERIPEEVGRASPWFEPAEDLTLPPVRRGTRAQSPDDPLRERRAERDALVRSGLERRALAAQRLAALFPDGRLDLAAVHLPSAELRDELLALLGRCLAAPDGAGEASDGGRIAVLEWTGGMGRLEAPDGVCHVPRLVLVWEPAADLADAAAGGRGA